MDKSSASQFVKRNALMDIARVLGSANVRLALRVTLVMNNAHQSGSEKCAWNIASAAVGIGKLDNFQ